MALQVKVYDKTGANCADVDSDGKLAVKVDVEAVTAGNIVNKDGSGDEIFTAAKPGTVQVSGSAAVLAGEKVVAAAATPEALAASTACRSVIVQAKKTNTKSVYLGNAAGQYVEVEAGASVLIPVANLSTVYVKVQQNGEGVNYLGVI